MPSIISLAGPGTYNNSRCERQLLQSNSVSISSSLVFQHFIQIYSMQTSFLSSTYFNLCPISVYPHAHCMQNTGKTVHCHCCALRSFNNHQDNVASALKLYHCLHSASASQQAGFHHDCLVVPCASSA